MPEPIAKISVLNAFHSKFGRSARVFKAPARINIIGEHCDYNDGFVMPSNTALYTWLAIAPRDDRKLRILASDFKQTAELHLDQLPMIPGGGWQDYIKGVLLTLRRN